MRLTRILFDEFRQRYGRNMEGVARHSNTGIGGWGSFKNIMFKIKNPRYIYYGGRHKIERRERRVLGYNNYWQKFRERTVKNKYIVSDLAERGIKIHQPEELFTDHLPPLPTFEGVDFDADDPELKPFDEENEASHPYYHEKPCYAMDNIERYPTEECFQHALSLTKSVEIPGGLPSRILKAMPKSDKIPEEADLLKDALMEVMVCDSTQDRLPKRWRIPWDGKYHPVLSQTTNKVPYEVKYMYFKNEPARFGITAKQKILNLTRQLFRMCEHLYPENERHAMENGLIRQYFERDNYLTRIALETPMIWSSPNPLKPFVNADQVVSESKDKPVTDIYPLNPLAKFDYKHIYRYENNFPILSKAHSHPYSVVGFYFYRTYDRTWSDKLFHACSLTSAFNLALAQARLRFGKDVSGDLPEPVTVQFITTSGQTFHFSAFQLNTLNLDGNDGKKNFFWHETELTDLFEVCDYVQALPTLEGYNHEVFRKIVAMYRQK